MDSQSGAISSLGAFEDWHALPLEQKISSGGSTCDVYKTLYDERYVFVKCLKHEFVGKKAYHDIFRKEYAVGATLNSEHFPRYIDYSEENGRPVIMMEYVDGLNLKDFIHQNPKYFHNSGNLKRFLTQLLDGLAHLHSHQIVHLDLKPENILITRVNNDVRIIDLGYCYADSTPFTQGRTNNYAAPEQFDSSKHVDARTDIFAVGRIIDFILNESGHKNRLYSNIAKRCTKDDPAKRFQNEKELLRTLNSTLWRNRFAIMFSLLFLAIAIPSIYVYSHINYYDFVYYRAPNNYYCKIIPGTKNVTLVSKYDWGGGYDVDMSILTTVRRDGEPFTVVEIGDSAFRKSTFDAVEITSTVRTIGERAFADCQNLTTLYLPDGIQSMGSSAFAGCLSLSIVRLSPNTKEIPQACFVDCHIQSLKIPEGVERICRDAFVGNNFLTEVHLPSTLKALERGVFYHCERLERIDIPANVTTLGEYLLYECPNLKEIYNHALVPQTCTSIVERKKFKGTIYVPAQSLETYRHAQGWEGLNIQPIRD